MTATDRIALGLAEIRRNAPVCADHGVLACVVCYAHEYALVLDEAQRKRREPVGERFDLGGES